MLSQHQGSLVGPFMMSVTYECFDLILSPFKNFIESIDASETSELPTSNAPLSQEAKKTSLDNSLNHGTNHFKAPQSFGLAPIDHFIEATLIISDIKSYLDELIKKQEPFEFLKTDEDTGVLSVVCKTNMMNIKFKMSEDYKHVNMTLKHAENQTRADGKELEPTILKAIEQFFVIRVASPPFRNASVKSFMSLVSLPRGALVSMAKLIMLDICSNQNVAWNKFKELNFKWNVRLCTSVPPNTSPISSQLQIGQVAIHKSVNSKNDIIQLTRLLFFIKLDKISNTVNLVGSCEQSLPIPIIFEASKNEVSLCEQHNLHQNNPMSRANEKLSPAENQIKQLLYTFKQQNIAQKGKPDGVQYDQIFDAIKYLMQNLTM